MDLERKPIAFFIGSVAAENIQVLLENLDDMLGDQFPLHLITTTPSKIDESIKQPFEIFGQEYKSGMRGAFKALWDYHDQHNPRVTVQLTSPTVHGLIVGTIATHFGTPTVYRYSGDRFDAYRHLSGWDKITAFTVNNIFGKISLKFYDKYVVLGSRGKYRLHRRGVDRSDITILPPSVNRDRVVGSDMEPNLDVPASRSIALFLGRVHPLKGSETLERKIPEILSRREDIQFVFVGENYGFDIPTEYSDNVTMVGRIPPDSVPGYLRRADVLIHPSLTEGLPRVILESLAASTPVIARDVGEISSVTENTFTDDDQFVDMVCEFESLPLDDVTSFTRSKLAPPYVSFFKQF